MADRAENPTPSGAPAEPGVGGAPRPAPLVQVVEGSAIIRQLLCAALEVRGYRARGAPDATEALRQISASVPDLIVLNLVLPGIDGVALLKSVRSTRHTGAVPVLVVSDQTDRQTVLHVISLRVSGYLLTSTFVLEQFLEKVAQILGMARPGQARPPKSPEQTARAAHPAGGTPQAPASAPAVPAEAAPSPGGPPADPVEALKSIQPLLERGVLLKRLSACDQVKAMSPTVTRIIKMTSSPNCEIDLVAEAVSQDQAIALKILRLANSAVYSRGDVVDTVHKAVLRIGLERIRQTVMNIAVIDHFSTQVFSDRFNFAHFWEHSISVGIIAAELAHLTRKVDPDRAFTMGLLHDVGRILCVELLPDEYAKVMEAAYGLELPLEQVESRMLSANHADVMEKVLTTWGFSRQLADPITFHHLSAPNIRKHAVSKLAEVAVLALANRLSHALLLGSSGNDVIYPTDAIIELLGLDPAPVARIEETAVEETRRVKLAMLTLGSTANWPDVRERYHAMLEVPFRPLFVSVKAEIDAHRIFCRALSQATSTEAPNVAVMHLTDPRDAVPATNLVRAAEEDAGVANLPLIVLSGTGKLKPQENILVGRSVELLSTPITISRFIRAVNHVVRGADAAPAASAPPAPDSLKAAA